MFSSCLLNNWGSEADESQSYHNGNSDPRGFGKTRKAKINEFKTLSQNKKNLILLFEVLKIFV